MLSPWFTLRKLEGDFTNYTFEKGYDIIYFDAFAPEKQPEMWNQSLFDGLYNILNEGGILTTYCAKGVVRRMLQTAGFTVERLPGPPGGKREILRATK
jgi:tRNA U34 5-methylaminomethyl-2-thiouridine-forming methyltransferase MnmC